MFLVTYGFLVVRNVRGFRLPIWTIIFGGAIAMVGTGSIGVADAYNAVNLRVIVFLFSMFVLVTALDLAGSLERFVGLLVLRAKSHLMSSILRFSDSPSRPPS